MDVDVDIGAVPVPVGVKAVTRMVVVEVRRKRRMEVSERILVFVCWMIRSRDGCAHVKVQRYTGMAGWRFIRERGGGEIAIPCR